MMLRLVVCLALTYVCAALNANCPVHLVKNEYLQQYGSSCYEFVLDQADTWHYAQATCRAKGGHLVDIHTYGEEGFIYNACQSLGFHGDKGVWIGLTDEVTEGIWEWTSGKPVTFNSWASGQPGMLSGSEDCALLQYSEHGNWHDYPCDGNFLFGKESHGWICEYEIA
ncbi:hypothetical protein ACF0H5_020055 [Mactra antiquata]